jgi:glyoxylase-like metal-dependent hydrolase (beta-lactamase superfamily II)
VPHGTARLGDLEITALCDMAPHFPEPFSRAFPTIPAERHDEIRTRYPAAFDGPDEWVFHDHCFLVRTPSTLILFDTGMGGPETLGAQWIETAGALPGELESVGVEAEDVDVVAISHAHLDHIGWNLIRNEAGADPRPRFPNARYALQRAEWDHFPRGDDDGSAFDDSLAPLEALGVLGLVDGDERLADGVTLHHTPGHTPGHQVMVLEADGHWAVLSGDLSNHPAQTSDPTWRTGADMAPDEAAATRAEWFDRIEGWNALLCTAHFPEPFGHLLRAADGTRAWDPRPPKGVDEPRNGESR